MTIASKLQLVIDVKDAIRQSIIAKGVDLPVNIPFDQYSTKIAEIETSQGGEETSNIKLNGTVATGFTTVTIPEGVTSLGKNAFRSLLVDYVELPSTLVRIEEGSLQSTPIKEIIIPESVTTIDTGAFRYCNELTTLDIANGVGDFAMVMYSFSDCAKLHTVNIGNRLTFVYSGAFQNCPSLTNLTLASTIKAIGDNAFTSAKLTTIDFPNIEIVGKSAFSSNRSVTTINLPNLKSLGEACFSQCDSLTSINIGNQVTTLPLNWLTSTKLTEYKTPDSVTKLERQPFSSMTLLTKLHITSGVTSIGDPIINNAPLLKTVIIDAVVPPTVNSVGLGIIQNVHVDCKIYVPDASVEAYKTATTWSSIAGKILPVSQLTI